MSPYSRCRRRTPGSQSPWALGNRTTMGSFSLLLARDRVVCWFVVVAAAAVVVLSVSNVDDDDDDDDGDDLHISLWSANLVRAPTNLQEAPVQLSSSCMAFCPSCTYNTGCPTSSFSSYPGGSHIRIVRGNNTMSPMKLKFARLTSTPNVSSGAMSKIVPPHRPFGKGGLRGNRGGGATLCVDGVDSVDSVDSDADEVCMRNGFWFLVTMAFTPIESNTALSRIRIVMAKNSRASNSGSEPHNAEECATT